MMTMIQIDCADSDCIGSALCGIPTTSIPPGEGSIPQCADDADNDGDSLIDFPASRLSKC